MIRTVVKAQNQKISIKIPKDYVGKQVEIIAFAVDEATSSTAVADTTLTHFASENILAKDWLTPEEDAAWQDL